MDQAHEREPADDREQQPEAIPDAERTIRQVRRALGAVIVRDRNRTEERRRWADSGCEAADELAGPEPSANRKAALRATVAEAVHQLGELCSEAELGALRAAVARDDWSAAGHEFDRIVKAAWAAEQSPLGPQADAKAATAPDVAQAAAAYVNETVATDAGNLDDERLAQIPALDKKSRVWVRNTQAAVLDGVEVRTLANYRCEGWTAHDGMAGIDSDGRKWRRTGTVNSHPWYYKPSLRSEAAKPSQKPSFPSS